MAVKPVIGVAGVGVGVVGAEVVAGARVVVVDEVGVHVIDAVIHDGCGDIFACDSLRPGGGSVEIEFGFAAVLAGIFQIPLVLVKGIGGVALGWKINQIFHLEWVIPTLLISIGK